nr:helix-turn-helix domain-containing protein [uncultured Aminipila sp.]
MAGYQEILIDDVPRIETLTVNKCAEITGMGQQSIRKLVNDPASGFPYFKLGAKVLIPVIALEQWMIKVSEERKDFS